MGLHKFECVNLLAFINNGVLVTLPRPKLLNIVLITVLIVVLCGNVAFAATIVTLQRASVSYSTAPGIYAGVYSADVGEYGKIYAVWPHGEYLYAITTRGWLLRSTDIVHWEVLGNVLPPEYRHLAHDYYRGGIYVTSNGTIIVNFCSVANDTYLLLRGTPDKFPFEVTLTGLCAWGNSPVVETDKGTLVTASYAGPLAYYGLVFTSSDMGKTWKLTLNITAYKTPGGRCLAARHIHYIYYDPISKLVVVAGGERDANMPVCLDRVTFVSDDG